MWGDKSVNRMETYTYSAYCQNCGWTQKDVRIPKGTTAKEFLKDAVCRYCRCPIYKNR